MTVCHTYQALAEFKTWLLMCLELLSHVPVTPRKQESIGGNGQLEAIIQGGPGVLRFSGVYPSSQASICITLPYVLLFHMYHIQLQNSQVRYLPYIVLRIPIKPMLCDKQVRSFLCTSLLKAGWLF